MKIIISLFFFSSIIWAQDVGTTGQYLRGDRSWQTLNAAAVAGLKSGALFDTSRFVCDSTAFVTTGLRLAVFVSGMKSTGRIVWSARSAGEPVAPIAADQVGIQCKTDSVIFKRAASGTSGLKGTFFGYKW